MGLNIAAWLLVLIGSITAILLWHIYRKVDQRLNDVEDRQWSDSKQTQSNKDNLAKQSEILQELKHYSRKLDQRIEEDVQPRLRYVEREVAKRNGR